MAGARPGSFEIFNDVDPSRQQLCLPSGSCHYVDLSSGINGSTCGCRRFWPVPNVGSDQTGWCMCAHHACYHDQGPSSHPLTVVGQENERLVHSREPLSPVVDAFLRSAPTHVPLDLTAFSTASSLSFIHDVPEETLGLQGGNTQAPASMPDTLAWTDFIQTPPGNIGHPGQAAIRPPAAHPLNPRLLVPMSQTASTTSSARARYLRPFAGRGLNTLKAPTSNVQQGGPHDTTQARARHVPRDPAVSDGSLALVSLAEEQPGGLEPPSGTATQTDPKMAAGHRHGLTSKAFRNLSDTVSGHEQRLDCLETRSFTASGHEECAERHDHMDLRVTELEQKMEGAEKAIEAATSSHKQGDVDDDVVAASNATTVTGSLHTHDLMSRIGSLESQVTHIMSHMPSVAHAWTVEVVFLPFPLQRLWQDLSQFKTEAAISNDDWSQIPRTLSSVAHTQTPDDGGWADESGTNADRLYPRACSGKSVPDRRLRSRGLIRTVSFRGHSARSVHEAINNAFGSLFSSMDIRPRHFLHDATQSSCLGLQELWVPLRKVHKDSRLRFLKVAEMLTPALWDVAFLHSVVMRGPEPRLFITHPDAYVQDLEAYVSGWDWQRIRELECVVPEAPVLSGNRDEGGMSSDHCWAHIDQLDASPSAPVGLRTHNSSTHGPPRQMSRRISGPLAALPFFPTMAGRRAQRTPHDRTPSVPPQGENTATTPTPSSGRGGARQTSPATRGARHAGVQKRRRSTRSPSYARTPRWTASASPMPVERRVSRGITPLAYATPYSNAPLQELRPIRGHSIARSTTDVLAAEDVFNMGLYQSDSDGSHDMDEDDGSDSDSDSSASTNEMVVTAAIPTSRSTQYRQQQPQPEDEVWPGIEDQARASDIENIDPQDVDQHSNASSQPSEYPATEGFHIHEDE